MTTREIILNRVKEYDSFIDEAQESSKSLEDKKKWIWGLQNTRDDLLYLLDLIQ